MWWSGVITTTFYITHNWDEYITPEGKFDIVLYGKSYYNEEMKKSIRQFVTNTDDIYPAKSPFGVFPDLYIPND